jgi:AraC-like DNA-binding protein
MRLPQLPVLPTGTHDLPLWPPLLATRGAGSLSTPHAHHTMHFVLGLDGDLRTRASSSRPWTSAAGVLTASDVPHAIDARGVEVLLVFLDPQSEVGAALAAVLQGSLRLISSPERATLLRQAADPAAIMRADGAAWTRHAVETLGAAPIPGPRTVHPRVRKLLRLLRTSAIADSTSLESLSQAVGLSPGRLMHVFTASIGVPFRPYLAWCKLQRAAGAIVSGVPLAQAAHAAGFADAAHMSRTFRRMFGIAPSALRPPTVPAS